MTECSADTPVGVLAASSPTRGQECSRYTILALRSVEGNRPP